MVLRDCAINILRGVERDTRRRGIFVIGCFTVSCVIAHFDAFAYFHSRRGEGKRVDLLTRTKRFLRERS